MNIQFLQCPSKRSHIGGFIAPILEGVENRLNRGHLMKNTGFQNNFESFWESDMIYFTAALHVFNRFVDLNLFLTAIPAHAASVALMRPTSINGANPPVNAAVQDRFATSFSQVVPKLTQLTSQLRLR